MFSLNHIIWIIICAVLSIIGGLCIKKYKPSFTTMVNICFLVGIISEVVKIFSVCKLVPIVGKEGLYPYVENHYLPLHLCSLQILVFAYLKICKKESELTYWIVCFMYPCCIIGGVLAIIIPSIFNTSISVSQAFIHPLAYQTFLYHTMLIIFGIYLYNNDDIKIKKDGYKKSLITISILGFVAIYLNSIFTTPVYENGELVAVASTTNFFFVSLTPISIPFSYKWHWMLYILIIAILAVVLIGLLYLPIYFKERKLLKNSN